MGSCSGLDLYPQVSMSTNVYAHARSILLLLVLVTFTDNGICGTQLLPYLHQQLTQPILAAAESITPIAITRRSLHNHGIARAKQ